MDRAELRENFDHFDGDDNGRIDRQEFAQLMAALDAEMSEEDLDIGFGIIDTDGSGQIDFGEFAAWWEEQ
jgi:calmodulin